MKGFLKNRLDYIYLLMCILNYALIFFIGAIVTISIQRIIDIARARSFMDMLDYLPGDGLTNFIFSMICFFVLLFIMIIPRMRKLNGKEIIIYYAFEICLCLLIINFKQFFDLTLCNSANGGKTCIYGLFRHLLYGETIRIWWQVPA